MILTPTASSTALAMAAAVGMMAVSPVPMLLYGPQQPVVRLATVLFRVSNDYDQSNQQDCQRYDYYPDHYVSSSSLIR